MATVPKELRRLARRAQGVMNAPLPLPLPLKLPGMGDELEDSVRDKVIMITGGSSGIGLATAERVAVAGGKVLLVARSVDKLQEAVADIAAKGGEAHALPCDLTDLEALDEMALRALDEHGRVDVLVNNAGRSIRRSLKLSYERFHDYERTMQLNYFAPVRLILRLVPGMRERQDGQVINISSVGVQTRVPRFGAYIASKAALDTLSDSLQAEVRDEGVRFTTIHMPLVRTPMIAPTKIYDRFPALTPNQAADLVCRAIADRPRRLSPAFGHAAAFADAVTPDLMDILRNRGFRMFPDSHAAKGDKSVDGDDESTSATGRAFARLTPGVHW